jgi:hypothetical protein
MNVNISNGYFLNEEAVIKTIQEFLKKLASILPKNFKSDTSQNMVDKKHTINNQGEVNNYDQTVEKLLNTMNDFLDDLCKDYRFKEEEFYDFMDIQGITEYILTKKKEHIELVRDLITNFIYIFELKIKNTENYDIQYKQFKKTLSEAEEEFYTKIYIPTNKHEKTINNIYQITKQDFAEE